MKSPTLPSTRDPDPSAWDTIQAALAQIGHALDHISLADCLRLVALLRALDTRVADCRYELQIAERAQGLRNVRSLADDPQPRCAHGHRTRPFQTMESGWWCSLCDRRIRRLAVIFSCEQCNYDLCSQCSAL